jgi:sugar fermentation stimulation protein A
MEYPQPLLEGVVLRRSKRFLCEVTVEGGTPFVAHLANPGSMRTCIAAFAPCRLLDTGDPKRKLPWSVEQIRMNGTWILVNTARPNVLVGEALAVGQIPELAGYREHVREQRYGAGSRIDWLLRGDRGEAYVEVKNATMAVGERGLFPDSKSERATRHMEELARVSASGKRAVVLFVVSRGDVATVSPADHIDPAYGRALRTAVAAGVEVLAYRCDVGAERLALAERVPVAL